MAASLDNDDLADVYAVDIPVVGVGSRDFDVAHLTAVDGH